MRTGRTLYILDEPTTGLHFHDIRQLLNVLQRLTDAGNAVVVIEHDMEVIKPLTGSSTWARRAAMKGGLGGGAAGRRGCRSQVLRGPVP